MITPPTHRYRPGDSPFHARGATYLGMREFIDRVVPGGLLAVLPNLPDDAHRAFLSQVFSPVSYYDALPIRPLSEAIAETQGIPYSESLHSRGVMVAQRDLGGLYKLLLKAVSPEVVASGLQRMMLRYFDFGAFHIEPSSKGRSQGRMEGIPSPLAAWIAPILTGYAGEALKAAGAASPRVRFEPPVRDGERGGVETVMVRTHMSWR